MSCSPMYAFQQEWCGGLYRIDRKQICSSVYAFLSQHNPNVSPQRLSRLAVSLEANAYDESACPVYYVETVVAKLHEANASISEPAPLQIDAPEQASCQQTPYQQEWRNKLTREERDRVLQHMVVKLTSLNEGRSPQAITEAATVFENCTFISVDSRYAYLTSIAEELSRCETYRTLPAPPAEILSLSLQQQRHNQPDVISPQSTHTQAITDSVPVPPTPSGGQNILNLEPGELMSHVFEQPNWKGLLTDADRQTIVRHIYSKLVALNLGETTQQTYHRAICFELDAFTRAQTGCSYLEYLIEIIGSLQSGCDSEGLLPPRRNEEQAWQDVLQPDITTLNSVSEQGPTIFGH